MLLIKIQLETIVCIDIRVNKYIYIYIFIYLRICMYICLFVNVDDLRYVQWENISTWSYMYKTLWRAKGKNVGWPHPVPEWMSVGVKSRAYGSFYNTFCLS